MAETKRRQIPLATWEAMRVAYIQGEGTVREISIKLGVNEGTAANVSKNPGERVASAMNASYQGTIVYRPVNSPFQS